MFDMIARPFGMLLMFFYNTFQNYGVAIIVLAIIIKLILLPFQMKSKRGMLRQSRVQPKLAEIQKKHGANKQKAQEETMKLYKEEGINPASGCIWGLLPMPILFAIFQVIRQPITIMMGVAQEAYQALSGAIVEIAGEAMSPEALGFHAQIQQSQWINDFGVDTFLRMAQETEAVIGFGLENFAEQVGNLQHVYYGFLGLNLSAQPQWDFLWNAHLTDELTGMVLHTSWLAGFGLFLIPFFAAAAQFASMRINRKYTPQATGPDGQQAKGMMMVMNFMPLMSVYIGFITPGALGFYWLLSSALQTIQDIWLNKVYMKKIEAEEAVKNAERDKKAAELEAKRLETERLKAEGKIVENKNTSKRKKQRGNRQEQQEKAAEWEKKRRPDKRRPAKNEPGRVGDRRYARGRAYDPDRYKNGTVASASDDIIDDDNVNEDAELEAEVLSESSDIQGVDSDDSSDELISNDESDEDFEDDVDDEDDEGYEDDDGDDDEYEEYEEDDEYEEDEDEDEDYEYDEADEGESDSKER